MVDAEQGRVVLGGCDPTFPAEILCSECGRRWGPAWGPARPRPKLRTANRPDLIVVASPPGP
jgi:hypothetical protein